MMSRSKSRTKPGPVIAVLGTGTIGAPMARNLARAGFDVRVCDRVSERSKALVADGATFADTPGEAVMDADIVITSLYDAAVVRDVFDAAAAHLRPGAVWAEMSTIGIDDVAPLAQLAREHGVLFVDAPIQGAKPLAEKGELLIYAAGPANAQPVLEPVFDVLGRRTEWLDETHASTAATAIKLVVNAWVFALTTAAAEAVALAQALDVDPEHFRAAIAGGPLDNTWAQMKTSAIIEENFSPLFPVHAALKDTKLITDAAASADVRLDLATAVRDRFQRAVEQGHADDDMVATYHASFDERPNPPQADTRRASSTPAAATTFSRASIAAEAAQRAIAAATAEATSLGIPMTIAVVDESGIPKSLTRMDGASVASTELALDKAYTTVALGKGKPTHELFEMFSGDPSLLAGIPGRGRLTLIGGGWPIIIDGQVVGAVGVSGGRAVDDARVAQAGVAAVTGL